jgi:putative peptidoglycan lipid II flippase
MNSSRADNIAQNAAVISGATMASRVLGFVRDVVIAFALGAGPLADAFFVAFRVPNLLRRLFAEGSLTMAFVPVFTRTRNEEGISRAFVLSRSTLIWLLLILGCLTAIVVIAAKPVTVLMTAGWLDDPELFRTTVGLVRICFPYIVFISGVALCMGILNSMGHFLAPALAPCILNLSLIGAALAGVWSGLSIPVLLSVGVLVAGLGQWLLQQPFLLRLGFTWRGEWSLKDRGVRRIGWLMLPTVVGAAVYQLNNVVNTQLASFLSQGSISFLYYADRLVQFPLGVFGLAVSTAALPSLSSLAASARLREFSDTLNATLGLILFISLPAAAGLIGLREPLIRVLFERGAFEAGAVQATAGALFGYAVGLPAFSCVRALVSAYYALEDTVTPVVVASICLVFNAALGLALMQFLAHVGLAVAVSCASWLNILLLGAYLRRRSGPWFAPGRHLTSMAGLSVLIWAGSSATSHWGWPALALIPAWAGIYVAGSLLLGVPEARLASGAVRRRLGRRKE